MSPPRWVGAPGVVQDLHRVIDLRKARPSIMSTICFLRSSGGIPHLGQDLRVIVFPAVARAGRAGIAAPPPARVLMDFHAADANLQIQPRNVWFQQRLFPRVVGAPFLHLSNASDSARRTSRVKPGAPHFLLRHRGCAKTADERDILSLMPALVSSAHRRAANAGVGQVKSSKLIATVFFASASSRSISRRSALD